MQPSARESTVLWQVLSSAHERSTGMCERTLYLRCRKHEQRIQYAAHTMCSAPERSVGKRNVCTSAVHVQRTLAQRTGKRSSPRHACTTERVGRQEARRSNQKGGRVAHAMIE